ncbi:MAG: transposase, partial [Desulfobacterales bacterium]|nr:transposase [Desulfobacterales bacterium]
YAWIDGHSRIHFITTYSTYFAQDLAAVDLDRFEPVDIEKNRELEACGQQEDRLLAYRTKGEYWGKQRCVIVTYNPKTARKQTYTFEDKLERLRQELLAMRAKVRANAAQWRDPEVIQDRYLRLCQQLHISPQFYRISFDRSKDGLKMSFRKDPYQVGRKKSMLGKNIIITDNMDWSTREIVEASLDRWQVEDRFRVSNDDDLVGVRPIRHWTDSKIRCHLFTCVAAMVYLRRLELRLAENGINRTAEDVMEEMRHLHSVLTLKNKDRKPARRLEPPSKTQAEVLSAFKHRVDKGGVLHPE